jgi:hypothetical protein
VRQFTPETRIATNAAAKFIVSGKNKNTIGLRSGGDERVPYSVYNHARQWSNPDEVINYYLTHRCGVDEIETIFRISEPDEAREQFAKTGLPRMFIGVWREMVGLSAERRERAIALLREVLEVIGWQK